MSENSRRVNNFFKSANRADLQIITDDIIFSERQEKVMEMFYLKKKYPLIQSRKTCTE